MIEIDYQNYKKQSDFLKFAQGDNVVRMLTVGRIGIIYSMKTSKTMLRFGEFQDIPTKTFEKYKNSIKGERKWSWIAINRTTCQVGLLEVGSGLGNQICGFNEDPKNFDLIINRQGLTKEDTVYKVSKSPESKPSTEKEKALISEFKDYLINKYF